METTRTNESTDMPERTLTGNEWMIMIKAFGVNQRLEKGSICQSPCAKQEPLAESCRQKRKDA